MALAAVLNVATPPGNFTAVDVSVPKVAVFDPVPSCTMINDNEPPVGKLVITNPVLVPNVTLCTGAKVALTVMVVLLVNELIFSV